MGGLQALPAPKSSFAHNQEVHYGQVHSPGEPGTIQKTPRGDAHDAEREVLKKLLTDEEAKEPLPKNGIL